METVATKQATAYDSLKGDFGYSNVHQSPKITKVTVSSGVGKSRSDKNRLSVVEDRLSKITGQKPSTALAKKSIAQFKVRAGDLSGYKVSLSGKRAMNFVDKLVHVAIPRTKDLRGINTSAVDAMGNMTIGIKEHTIFPETSDEEIRDIFGMAVTITTTASSREEALAFFKHLGIPFKKDEA